MNIKTCPGQPLTEREIDNGIQEASIGRYKKEGDLIKAWRNNPYRCMGIGHKCPSRSGKTYFRDFEERVIAKLDSKNHDGTLRMGNQFPTTFTRQ